MDKKNPLDSHPWKLFLQEPGWMLMCNDDESAVVASSRCAESDSEVAALKTRPVELCDIDDLENNGGDFPRTTAVRPRERSRSRDAERASYVPSPSSPRLDIGRFNEAEYVRLTSCKVLEVDSYDEKMGALNLHMSKNTFHEERGLVQQRIFNGSAPQYRCRTWILVPPSQATSDVSGAAGSTVSKPGRSVASSAGGKPNILAAVTVRLNKYQKRKGRWGQILNMSTKRERQGFGAVLIAGLEELLRQEEVDVVVLYPAENGRAPAFWSSVGYSWLSESLLPPEELIPNNKGGPLLPEFDPQSQKELQKLEKLILISRGSQDDAESAVSGGGSAVSAGGRKGRGKSGRAAPARVRGRPKLITDLDSYVRDRPASESWISGLHLLQVWSELRELMSSRRNSRPLPVKAPPAAASPTADREKANPVASPTQASPMVNGKPQAPAEPQAQNGSKARQPRGRGRGRSRT